MPRLFFAPTTAMLCLLCVVGPVAASSSPASANDDRKTQLEQERAAKKACAMGNYEKGADILTDLLLATNDPTYIYNQARCYEQNSLWERAISRFREYLRKANRLSERDRVDTEKHIAECQAALAQQTAMVRSATPEAPVTNPAPAPAGPAYPPATAPVQSVDSTTTSPAAPTPGRALRIAGIACGVIGVAALGTGVGLGVVGQGIGKRTVELLVTRARHLGSADRAGVVRRGQRLSGRFPVAPCLRDSG